MHTWEEIEEVMRQVEADMPRLQAIKRKQLEFFQKIAPDKCGKIDFEKNEVVYNDERYTKDFGNYYMAAIEDWIRCFNLVGLDYELRIAELYDSTEVFNVKFPDTEDENRKYWLARELHLLYSNYYRELLLQNGMDNRSVKGYRYIVPWTGCERELNPDKYAQSLLLTENEIFEVLEKLYPEAHKRMMQPRDVMDLNFEKIMTNEGSKRLCKARLDEVHFQVCKKTGFQILSIDIPPEKFVNPVREEVQEGRKIYYFEFILD